MRYSRVEEEKYFEIVPCFSSEGPFKKLAASACTFGLDLEDLDVDQAYIQSQLNTGLFLKVPLRFRSMRGKVVRLSKALCDLKQSSCQRYYLMASTRVEVG